MRAQWIVIFLSTLASMGLVVIIMGQNHVTIMLRDSDTLSVQLRKLDDQLSNLRVFEEAIGKLLAQGDKALEDLTPQVDKLGPEIETKKKAVDSCEAEKKIKDDELAGVEKEFTETEANLKPESDTWHQETAKLKAQLLEFSPICNYVKSGSLAGKLCGTTEKPSTQGR